MKKIFLLLILAISLSSCEKVMFDKDQASSSPQANFDYLWNQINNKYSYFELKHLNWDSVKTVYQAKISEDMGDEKLFNVLGSMMDELRDDHSNLISPFDVSRYNVARRHNENYNSRTIENIFPNIHITGAFHHDTLPGNIAYISYRSFMNTASDKDLDFLLTRYKDTKGLIFDVRENGGGNVVNVTAILERFASEKTKVGYFITKNGPGKNDFSAPQDYYIDSYKGIKYTKPIVVLIDRGSFSATTMFALGAKALPNITLIGDTTGGGGGLPNGGQLPNGWFYRFSISQMLDLNMKNYAENGIPPDINASFDWSDLNRDEIIERAVQQLN